MNYNENKILSVMKDKEYLENLNINAEDVKRAVILAKDEYKELNKLVQKANLNKEKIEDLCDKLSGFNEDFRDDDIKYFDANYKSLLITISEDKNTHNIKLANDVYIYPDNITSVATDEMFILYFDLDIDFEKIEKIYEKELEEENEIQEGM